MAKGHRSKIKRERNEVRDTRPSAKLSYARVSVQKACFVLEMCIRDRLLPENAACCRLPGTDGGQKMSKSLAVSYTHLDVYKRQSLT